VKGAKVWLGDIKIEVKRKKNKNNLFPPEGIRRNNCLKGYVSS